MASVFRRFRGFIFSSLDTFCSSMVICSGRASEDWDIFRAFCADPRIPSLLKFVVRAAFAELGDLRLEPLVLAPTDSGGISTVKLSLFGKGNTRPELLVPPMDRGESPVDDGDILLLFGKLMAADEVTDAMTEVICAVALGVPAFLDWLTANRWGVLYEEERNGN